jgi:hypothetical protein
MNIKSKGNQIFNIPNNSEGKQFLKLCRKYLNKKSYSIRPRGRGSRKIKGNQSSVPLNNAQWLALYFSKKIKNNKKQNIYGNQNSTYSKELIKQQHTIENQKQHIIDLHNEIDNLLLAVSCQLAELEHSADLFNQDIIQIKKDIQNKKYKTNIINTFITFLKKPLLK